VKKNILLMIYAVALLIGCSQPADIKNAIDFSDSRVAFSYPGNWKVVVDEEIDGVRNLYIESNQSAMTYILNYSDGIELTLDAFQQEYIEVFKNKISTEGGMVSVSKSVPVEAKIEGKTRSGIKNRLVVQIHETEDVFHQIYYLYPNNNGITYIIFQVADHDLTGTIKGFELILSTMHNSNQTESF